MSPLARRAEPLHRQVYDWFAERIAAGAEGFRPGDKLPSVRETARAWGVGFQAAQHAYELLAAARLVETRGRAGTYVLAPRAAVGPAQRARAAADNAVVTMRAAELVPVPAYVRAILSIAVVTGTEVVRREWVTADSAGPFMLSVSWVPAVFAEMVPGLLEMAPLPDPRGAAHLIADRAGLVLDWGRAAREARPVLDDGREAEALGLGPDGCVLAETWIWEAGRQPVEYGEFIVKQGRVIESGMEP